MEFFRLADNKESRFKTSTRDLLKEESNIALFSKKFEIIAQYQNVKQALNLIYSTDDLELIKKMEKQSSLQKVAYQNPDKLGELQELFIKTR